SEKCPGEVMACTFSTWSRLNTLACWKPTPRRKLPVLGVPVLSTYTETRDGFSSVTRTVASTWPGSSAADSATLTCLEGFSLTSCESLPSFLVFGDVPSLRQASPALTLLSWKRRLPRLSRAGHGPRPRAGAPAPR